MTEVEYPLSEFQQRECVWCKNHATQEAVLSRGNVTTIFRCCDDPACIWRSGEMCETTVGAA